MNLDLTKAAVSDLRSIRAYTAEKWGVRQESKYIDGIWNKFSEISGDAKRFRYREDLFPGCQIASHEKHVILFRVQGNTIQVVRVLHSAMDFKRHLPDSQ